MSNNKSVLEEALLEAQQLEEAVKSNAKEILAATMKQEIEELVKESLNEQEVDDLVVMESYLDHFKSGLKLELESSFYDTQIMNQLSGPVRTYLEDIKESLEKQLEEQQDESSSSSEN